MTARQPELGGRWEGAPSRRTLLAGAVATAVVVGMEPVEAATLPGGFPAGVPLYRERYRNWDEVITTSPLLTCAPSTPSQVLDTVNWAHSAGYQVRPRGFRHTWSPMTVEPGADPARILILDCTRSLTALSMTGTDLRAQGGAEMTSVLAFLHRHGRGLVHAPAPGDVSVAGILAVGGHGSAIPADGESRGDGKVFGTVSNLVKEMTVVAWDATAGRYGLRTVQRSDPTIGALLTGVGRTLIVEVVLQTTPQHHLRSQSLTHIHQRDLFARPDRATDRSLDALLRRAGRVGLIWYTYTDHPWIQVWTPTRRRPLLSRPTIGPFNYPFADRLPDPLPQLIGRIVSGEDHVAPLFGQTELALTSSLLTATGARDMWGPSHHFIHFVRPTTLRVSAGSHAVITRRADVQRVVHEFADFYKGLERDLAHRGKYPINSCVEIRVTGIDDPAEVGPDAVAPSLSAAAPVPGHPEYDTVVWLDALTLPGTPHEFEAYAAVEHFITTNFADYAHVRPEWAKRWATTPEGSWRDQRAIARLPETFDQWDAAKRTFDALDPHRVIHSPLLTRIGL